MGGLAAMSRVAGFNESSLVRKRWRSGLGGDGEKWVGFFFGGARSREDGYGRPV